MCTALLVTSALPSPAQSSVFLSFLVYFSGTSSCSYGLFALSCAIVSATLSWSPRVRITWCNAPLEQFCVAKLVYPCFETYQVRKSPCHQSHLPWPGTAGIAHGGRMRSTQDSCDGCVEAASCLVRPRVHGPPVAPVCFGLHLGVDVWVHVRLMPSLLLPCRTCFTACACCTVGSSDWLPRWLGISLFGAAGGSRLSSCPIDAAMQVH